MDICNSGSRLLDSMARPQDLTINIIVATTLPSLQPDHISGGVDGGPWPPLLNPLPTLTSLFSSVLTLLLCLALYTCCIIGGGASVHPYSQQTIIGRLHDFRRSMTPTPNSAPDPHAPAWLGVSGSPTWQRQRQRVGLVHQVSR